MVKRFRNAILAAMLPLALACGPVRAADIVTPFTIDLPDGVSPDDVDITITDDGAASVGDLNVRHVAAGTARATWQLNSLAITGNALGGARLQLAGGSTDADAVGIVVARELSIGHDSLPATLEVTGTQGTLYVGRGATIFGLGALVIDGSSADAALDAGATAFTINTNEAGGSAIDLRQTGINSATLTVGSLEFNGGRLELGGANTLFTAKETSSIGGFIPAGGTSARNATLTLGGSGTVLFEGGLAIKQGGTVENAAGTGGSLSLAAGKGLSLEGGILKGEAGGLSINADEVTVQGSYKSRIDTTGAPVKFNAHNGGASSDLGGTALTVKSSLDMVGDNSVSVHSYTQSGGTVTTESRDPAAGGLRVLGDGAVASISGGVFSAAAHFAGGVDFSGNATLTGIGQTISLGGGKTFTAGEKTQINLRSGSLRLTGGVTAEIAGSVVFGGTASLANTLSTDGSITFAEGANITLDGDFSRVVTAADHATAQNTLVSVAGSLNHSFTEEQLYADNLLLGRFVISHDGRNLFVSEAERNGMLLDGTREDYQRALPLLADRYGSMVDNGFARNIYRSVVNPNLNPAGNEPGFDLLLRHANAAEDSGTWEEASYDVNMANFQAFAMGDSAADAGLAALYSGMNMSGVVDVAISTANAVVANTRDHLRKVAEVRAAVNNCVGSDSGLAATIINSNQANRIWFGGFGMWEDADSRNGLDGYRYESGGFIGGYDHAFGPVTVGAVFAYTKGSFHDKTALSHDSDISSYTTGVHAAYFHPAGFFATANGAWSYSDNQIRELRSDAGSGSAWNTGDYMGDTWTGAAEIGYDYRPNACLNITPSLGFTYIYASMKDHSEYLGGVRVGRVRGVENDAAYLPIRLEIGYEIPMGAEAALKMTANGGYAYNLSKDGIDGTFTPYGFANAVTHKMVGREPGRHSYNAGAAVRFVSDRFDIGLDYAYYHQARYNAHRLTATAGLRF